MIAARCLSAWNVPIGDAELLARLQVVERHGEGRFHAAEHLGAEAGRGAVDHVGEQRSCRRPLRRARRPAAALTPSSCTIAALRPSSVDWRAIATPGAWASSRNSVMPSRSLAVPAVRALTTSRSATWPSTHLVLLAAQAPARRRRARRACRRDADRSGCCGSWYASASSSSPRDELAAGWPRAARHCRRATRRCRRAVRVDIHGSGISPLPNSSSTRASSL